MMESRDCGVLDRPVKPDDDSSKKKFVVPALSRTIAADADVKSRCSPDPFRNYHRRLRVPVRVDDANGGVPTPAILRKT